MPPAAAATAEGRGAFGGFIGPRTLVALVRNTAPYLWSGEGAFETPPETVGERLHEHGDHPLGWWSLVRHAEALLPATAEPDARLRTEYFALCLGAHFATVTTFVPTDVDSKIRDALWYDDPDVAELRLMARLALQTARWDVHSISARVVDVPDFGAVSGHDGERLSVLCGGHLGTLRAGDTETAAELAEAVDAELWREARAFDRVAQQAQGAQGRRELAPGRALCCMAAHLTHNVGDVDQGLSAKGGQRVAERAKERFARLAHERGERYGGSFARAAAVYREVMAPEQHRHYPLRELKPLRQHPALLLPLAPFLDRWGETLATWGGFRAEQRAEVVGGLISGCRKVVGQEGYYRALAGFESAHPRGFSDDELLRGLPAAQRRELRDSTFRRKIAISRHSFESGCIQRALKALKG